MVFSTVLLARAIPKENAAVHGFIDGASAAIDMVKEMRARSPSGELPAPSCRTTEPNNTLTRCCAEFTRPTPMSRTDLVVSFPPGGFVDRD